jgi:hypothetical protein
VATKEVAMAGRKIRDIEDAQACLKAARAARGMSRGDWARQQGIDGRSLNAWGRNLARRRKASGKRQARRKKTGSAVVELVACREGKDMTRAATTPAGATETGRYVVRCGPYAVEVDGQFHDQTLRRLLQVVVGC